ncbi:MAG: hypothetical protein J2P46_19880, partial [Zavarzinella sp.]|nr:hypothetical protein [Zavarzinella sp.]
MFPSYTPSRWNSRRILALEALEDRTNPAPPLLQTIPGITFDEDGANNGGGFSVPPDPNGAAGPTHVVSIVNTSIEFHRISDSAQQVSESLDTFFAPLSPTALLFDPKVVYDQFENRFVVVCLEQSDTPQISRVLLAVSDDSDPNGTWRFVAINSRLSIGGGNAWADYPGFAVDEEAVYVTANMFQFSGSSAGVRLWIIAKGTTNGWYAGGTPTVSAPLNPYPSGSPVTSMPAQIYGTPPAGATGTFLVGYDGISNGTNESVKITRIDNPLGTPSFATQLVSVGDIDNTGVAIPGAPQSGTATTIDAGDRRVLNAVWRNSHLYFAATVDPGSGPDAGQATAHWFDVNTTNPGSLTLTDQGNIGGEDIAPGTYTFYPNVAVDAGGNLGIGFAASGPSIFPGAYYTGRKASDPAGTVQATGTLQAGVAFYVREFSPGENRWGDYSGLALAPDGWTFWAFNEYAMTQGTPIGTGLGRWATEWGRFSFNTPPRVTSPIPDVTVNEDAAPT